jgi:hypothetical protein
MVKPHFVHVMVVLVVSENPIRLRVDGGLNIFAKP